MANLQIGLQLMVVGLSLVFFVLFLLMYLMKLMSAIILNVTPTQSIETGTGPVKSSDNERELAAVMAIAFNRTVELGGKSIEIKRNQTN